MLKKLLILCAGIFLASCAHESQRPKVHEGVGKYLTICSIDVNIRKYENRDLFIKGNLVNGGHFQMNLESDSCPNISYRLIFDKVDDEKLEEINHVLWSRKIDPGSRIVKARLRAKIGSADQYRTLHVAKILSYKILDKN
jgi:hypothetical protein